VEQVPSLVVKDEKLKKPTNGANYFNNFFTITERKKGRKEERKK
jgi:hypothetical protein